MNTKSRKACSLLCLCLSTCLFFTASAFNIYAQPTSSNGLVSDRLGARNSYLTRDTDADGETFVGSRFFELIFGKEKDGQAKKDVYLCPGGDAFGVKICGSGVTVSKIAFDSGDSQLAAGDKIIYIDHNKILTIDDVKNALSNSNGRTLNFKIMRDGEEISLKITPKKVGDEYHIGAVLHDGTSGIGTITYYDPETYSFGGLGHGITDKDTKSVLNMTRGTVTGVILAGAKRGEAQHPGELRGVLTDTVIGSLRCNTECGVFGTLNKDSIKNASSPIKVATRDEVECGPASIISTIKSGNKAEYSIEITEITRDSLGTKSFKIHVTDDTLIALTGGIVRGMSGSPIIQNGKLVGAVTHVMVANPTEGYGIFIENMLNAAEMPMAQAA